MFYYELRFKDENGKYKSVYLEIESEFTDFEDVKRQIKMIYAIKKPDWKSIQIVKLTKKMYLDLVS